MSRNFRFDDFGFDGKLAIVDRVGNYEWVECQITSVPSEGYVRVAVVGDDGEGDDDMRRILLEYLEENYEVEIPCDFREETKVSRAVAKARKIVARFRGGDYAPFVDGQNRTRA